MEALLNHTVTRFGRHWEHFEGLEGLLHAAELPEHTALIVGAGLSELGYLFPPPASPPAPKWLIKQYSWEYLELAAVLVRLGKPWRMTVVDISSDVCNAVRLQEEAIISDYPYARLQPAVSAYARNFLGTFGVLGNDEARLRALTEFEPRFSSDANKSVFNTLRVPSEVRERLDVVEGDVRGLDRLKLPHETYNLVICFQLLNDEVHNDLSPSDKDAARDGVRKRISNYGYLLADYKTKGLLTIPITLAPASGASFSPEGTGFYLRLSRFENMLLGLDVHQ